MKKYFYLLLLIVISLCFNACEISSSDSKEKKKEKAKLEQKNVVTEKEAKLVKRISSMISINDEIIVEFYNNQVKENKLNIDLKGKVFNLDLKTDGRTYWKKRNELAFKPNKIWKERDKYNASLNLEKLFPNISDLKGSKIDFQFEILGVELESLTGDFKYIDKNDPSKFTFQGEIIFTNDVDINDLKSSLEFYELVMGEKNLEVIISKPKFEITGTANKFKIKSEEILRKSHKKNFKIKLNKEKLKISQNYGFDFFLSQNSVLQIKSIKKSDKIDDKFIAVNFTDDLEKDFNYDGFIRIEPHLETSLKISGKKITINGDFVAGQEYKGKVLKGLKNKWGDELKEDYEFKITMPEVLPAIEFFSNGIILPESYNGKLTFKSINVKNVTVVVKKIFEPNMTYFLQLNSISGKKDLRDQYYSYFYNLGITEYTKKYDLDTEKNKWKLYDLDLSEVFNGKKRGIYLIELSYDLESSLVKLPSDWSSWEKRRYINNNGTLSKPIILSSISMFAKQSGDNLTVYINDIETGEPVKGVKVVGKSYYHVIKDEKESSETGEVVLKSKDVRFIEAYYGESKIILDMSNNEMNTSDFNINGQSINKEGLKAFIYTERGVYRPGDEINVSAIIRDNTGTFPKDAPVKLNFYNPRGRKVESKLLKKATDGFYSFKLETGDNSQTGEWKAEILVANKIFNKYIKVETVVPYKLRVKLECEKETLYSEDKILNVDLSSEYLFGAPANSHNTFTTFSLVPYDISFKKYNKYNFKDNMLNMKSINSMEYENILDEEGKTKLTWTLPQVKKVPSGLRVEINSRVLEKSGRPVPAKKIIPYNFYDYYVGLKRPSNYYLQLGSKVEIEAIIVNKMGNAVKDRTIKYRIFKNDYYWWWDYNSEEEFRRHYKQHYETSLIKSGEITSAEESRTFSFTPQDYGRYLIEAEDVDGHISNFFVSAYSWGDSSESKNKNIIKMKTDKKAYMIGEKAKIILETPKQGRMLVSIEKGPKTLKSFWVDLKEAETVLDIDVTADMLPNVYVIVTAFQKNTDVTESNPNIMYGMIPLFAEDSKTRLEFDIKTPEKVQPNSSFEVEFQTKNNKKAQFTVAVVDEGLLNITGFKTPKPWEHFFQKEALIAQFYELYTLILGRNSEIVSKTLKIGGGYEEEYAAKKTQGTKAKRFKAVSIFKEPIETDENGFAKVKIDMPNYIGSVKVMVVAAKENSYASREKDVIVKSELMVAPSLPRVLSPKDKFVMPVTVFATEANLGEVTVAVEFDGPVETKILEKKLMFEKIGEQDLTFEFNVKDEVGIAHINVTAISKDYSTYKNTEIGVRAANPYIYKSEMKIAKKGEQAVLKVPNDGLEGTNSAKLILSKQPVLKLNNRLKYLIRYPYGCIEQTVSSVFPQLFIRNIFNIEKSKVDYNINAGIARLKRFQISSGGFSYWPNGSDDSEWGSNYGFHFLIEAKENGYNVPDDLYANLLKYQETKAREKTEIKLANIYRVYLLALAKKQNVSSMNYYKEKSDKLNNTEKYLLAASYAIINELKTAENILENATFDVEDYLEFSGSYGSSLRDKSLILETLSLLNRKDKGLELYKEIVDELENDYWYSTQTTAYSLLAISKFVGKAPDDDTNMEGKIYYPNGKVEEFNSKENRLEIEIKEGFGKDVKVELKSNQSIFMSLDWEGIPKDNNVETEFKNLKIQLDWFDQDGNEIDITEVKRGTVLWGLISVYRHGYRYDIDEVSLLQIMPSGWEIENLRLTGESIPDWLRDNNYFITEDYLDIRDDRLIWFFDYRWTNRVSFAFKVNTVSEGEFYLPPTVAEAMYNNNYKAVLKGQNVKVIK